MLDLKSFTENFRAVLNAPPRITGALATAAGILMYNHERGWFPLPSSVLTATVIVGTACGGLFFASLVSAVWAGTASLRDKCSRTLSRYRDKKRIEGELEYLTPKEREIIGYLLATKQKMFEVLPDGEECATLISKGFLVYPARRPVAVHRDVCVEVPDHVWQVLMEHQAMFPSQLSTAERPPWRTHWMAR